MEEQNQQVLVVSLRRELGWLEGSVSTFFNHDGTTSGMLVISTASRDYSCDCCICLVGVSICQLISPRGTTITSRLRFREWDRVGIPTL